MVGVLGLLALSLSPPAWSQCPAKTTVNDTLFNADGTLAAGRVVIAWPTFQIGTCQVIAGQTTVTVNGGAFSVDLYPNDAAVPPGTSYRVAYYLRSGRITTEYWVVPTNATPVSLAAVRSSSVPVPAVMFSQSQVTSLVSDLARKVELPSPCPAGKFLQANGSSDPPQVSCVDGTGAPLASATQSGTVKTDVTEADPLVYAKATTDSLLAGKANTAHLHSAADTTSGVFDPARLPNPSPSALGGIKSGSCSGTDKVTGVSTAGAITCGADQSGGGAGSQHQVNGTNLTANDPVNFQDSTTIAFVNPSAGNVQASVRDASVTAGKLSIANPTGAQLSGLGDVNIPAGALSPNRISGVAEVQANKGAASGYASLDASSKVVQDPANAQTTAAASRIPLADGSGKIADGWLSSLVSLLGQTIDLASEITGTLSIGNGGTGQTSFSAGLLRSSGSALSAAELSGDVTTSGSNATAIASTTTHTVHVPLECYNPRVKSLAGNAFFDVEGLTTGDFDNPTYKFLNNVDGRITCVGRVPNEMAATPAAAVIVDVAPHVACGASQNFRLNVRYRFFGDGTGPDTALTAEAELSAAGATTAHLATRRTIPASGSLSSAPSAGNNIIVEIQRNGASASDTCEQTMEIYPKSVVLRVDTKVK